MKPIFIGKSERTDLDQLTTWGGYGQPGEGENIDLTDKDL